VRTREQDGCKQGYWPRRPTLLGAVFSGCVSVSEGGGVRGVAQAMKVVRGDEGLDAEEESEADGDAFSLSQAGEGDCSSTQSDSPE
jgi:hypothetical protein